MTRAPENGRDLSRDLLLAQIAELYYIREETQQRIAEIVGMSRPQVSRCLAEAKRRGIVKIEIEFPDSRSHAADRLRDTFGLTDVIVVPTPDGGEPVLRERLASAAAQFIPGILRNGSTLGVAWGRTLASVVAALRPDRSKQLKVVQLIGGLCSNQTGIRPNEIVQTLAELYDAECYYLHAPAIVENPEMKETFLSSQTVRQTVEKFDEVDIAVVGLGTTARNAPVLESCNVTLDDVEALKRAGAVGDVCTRFYDIDGNECNTGLGLRSIAISLEQLRRIPTVVGVAGGEDKVKAVLGALRGRLVTALVTDERTANEVLKLHQSSSA